MNSTRGDSGIAAMIEDHAAWRAIVAAKKIGDQAKFSASCAKKSTSADFAFFSSRAMQASSPAPCRSGRRNRPDHAERPTRRHQKGLVKGREPAIPAPLFDMPTAEPTQKLMARTAIRAIVR